MSASNRHAREIHGLDQSNQINVAGTGGGYGGGGVAPDAPIVEPFMSARTDDPEPAPAPRRRRRSSGNGG